MRKDDYLRRIEQQNGQPLSSDWIEADGDPEARTERDRVARFLEERTRVLRRRRVHKRLAVSCVVLGTLTVLGAIAGMLTRPSPHTASAPPNTVSAPPEVPLVPYRPENAPTFFRDLPPPPPIASERTATVPPARPEERRRPDVASPQDAVVAASPETVVAARPDTKATVSPVPAPEPPRVTRDDARRLRETPPAASRRETRESSAVARNDVTRAPAVAPRILGGSIAGAAESADQRRAAQAAPPAQGMPLIKPRTSPEAVPGAGPPVSPTPASSAVAQEPAPPRAGGPAGSMVAATVPSAPAPSPRPETVVSLPSPSSSEPSEAAPSDESPTRYERVKTVASYLPSVMLVRTVDTLMKRLPFHDKPTERPAELEQQP